MSRAIRSPRMLLAVALLAAIATASCEQRATLPPPEVRNGDPGRGAQLITTYGCGTCHSVPGVAAARGTVGPPLDHMGQRSYIAGKLPNTGDNLQRWIRNPQQIVPGNAMPNLGVTSQDARDIAAYLLNLR
jgi:cytochrome c